MNTNYNCPMLLTRDLIGGKWKILILWRLSKGTHRFSDLKRIIPRITPKMLTQQLRELEADDLIHRKVYAQIPPKVEYSLTETGKSLLPVMDSMADFGKSYGQLKKIYKNTP